MASLVMMVGGAVVNALAFSGSNYMFSKFRNDKERKRHDIAMENLSQAQDTYEKNRISQLDFINERLKQQGHAAHTFNDVEAAIKEYYLVTGEKLQQSTPPKFTDFYQPTDKEKMQEIGFIAVGMSAVYLMAHLV